MAMAAGVCKPLGIFPPCLPTHRGASQPQQPIKCHCNLRQERSYNALFQPFHHKRVNASGRVYSRAATHRDGDKEDLNEECKDKNAYTEKHPCTETHASPDQPEPVEQQYESSAEREGSGQPRGTNTSLRKKLGCHGKTTVKNEDLKQQVELKQQQELEREPNKQQNDSNQEARCGLRCWLQHVLRPQNLLAAFLTGLLVYAFALFGWQVMVVAVDVTLFVLKCSFVGVHFLHLTQANRVNPWP